MQNEQSTLESRLDWEQISQLLRVWYWACDGDDNVNLICNNNHDNDNNNGNNSNNDRR